MIASFNYPDADTDADTKTAGNTFLWDYYYSKNQQKDAHEDIYQVDVYDDTYQAYYKETRELEQYPLLAAAEPYIIGFPSKIYNEFDLSGDWTAKNTATPAPTKLDKQTISFVSDAGITIGVSDDELEEVTKNGYSFMPNYMSKKVESYLMNTVGDCFDKTPESGSATVPFRPYFVANQAQGARGATRSIYFNMDNSGFDYDDDKQKSIEDELTEGTIKIYTQGQYIAVTSTLRETVPVQIYTASGALLTRFDISPDETVKTPAYNNGVYVVRAAGGKYQKKLLIK
jgi:hypothetical protein